MKELEIVETPVKPIQDEEPIPKTDPPFSSSSDDDLDRYKILVRKRITKPHNKFRLKSKALYNPTIKDKVIMIDEEPTNPNANPSTSKKVSEIKAEKNKPNKKELPSNRKAPTGKEKLFAKKQSKQSKKGSKPLTRSEDDRPRRMTTRSETKQAMDDNLDLLAEVAKPVFQGEFLI
jgi:hypothetical protein